MSFSVVWIWLSPVDLGQIIFPKSLQSLCDNVARYQSACATNSCATVHQWFGIGTIVLHLPDLVDDKPESFVGLIGHLLLRFGCGLLPSFDEFWRLFIFPEYILNVLESVNSGLNHGLIE